MENLFFAYSLPINKVVVWSSSNSRRAGPITQFVQNGVEIECGPQNSNKIIDELTGVLKTIIQNNLVTSRKPNLSDKKELYRVYGKLKKSELDKSQIKKLTDFKKTALSTESFYPLLVGRYETNDIALFVEPRLNIFLKPEYENSFPTFDNKKTAISLTAL